MGLRKSETVGRVAQSGLERGLYKARIEGSNPSPTTKINLTPCGVIDDQVK